MRRLLLSLVSLGCFGTAILGSLGMIAPAAEDRLGKLEWQTREDRLDAERRMTRVETWKDETEWEVHVTLAGVGALILERAFFGRRRGKEA